MITRTIYQNADEWLKARNEKPIIGSSDIADIMGLNPFSTPYKYWLKQKNRLWGQETNDEDAEPNVNLLRGHAKEDYIATLFEMVTGEKVIKASKEISVYRNDKYPAYTQVAPDRELFANGRKNRPGLECKDTKLYIPSLDKENCPKRWYVQIQYQMGIMERDMWYIAAEEGGKNFVYSAFPFEQSTFDYIMNYCCEWFERYILGDDVPPAETSDDADIMFPVAQPVTKQTDEAAQTVVHTLKDLKAQRKQLDEQINEAETQIKTIFGEAEALEWNGMTLATWKNVESQRLDTKALKADFPDLYAKYTKTQLTRKLLIK